MADGLFGGAAFGNPNIQRQGERARALAQQRNVNTLPDPRTYSAIAGLFGIRPDEMGFSVMHPQYREIMNVAEPAFYAGTALGVAPMVGFAGKALGPTAQAMRANAAMPSPFNAATRGQGGATVWHGSPHKFDKFDSSKIGTGEGAQAYGHGLYLAEARDVAQRYKEQYIAQSPEWKAISARRENLSDRLSERYGVSDISTLRGMVANGEKTNVPKKFVNALDQLDSRALDSMKNVGALYKVDLPDEQIAKMLDWDKPLSQQHPDVQKALKALHGKDALGRSLDKAKPMSETDIGQWLYMNIQEGRNQRLASEALAKQGIPGIRYLDGGSRGAGQGSSNYVVFPGNESMLKILERNNQPLDILQDTTKQNIFK